MKTPILSCFLALSLGTALSAAPLCDAFLSAEEMPKKYRKLAPVLSGDATDWIIPADQMDEEYAPDAQALLLLESIANAFQDRETQLAILMPPPRPIVAGQAALERLAGGSVSFDTEAVGDSFHQMIADLRGAGIVAPDLLDTAMGSDTLRADYYYRHDTHWTPAGAAESVVALADAVADAQIAAFSDSETLRPSFNNATEVLSERGSLADMARNVCGVAIDEVDRPIPHFPDQGLGLLDDTPDRPRILLAGS
ncbi:MAG: hypothetical protein GY883_18895, partial [Shimia sp.]|nr:hypothetical protein [Shimia sp.]